MRIAVIGAGVGGIASLRQMKKSLAEATEIVAFEMAPEMGGTWRYTDVVADGPEATSMYKNLRANLPKQVMQFSDYPFPEDYKTFMSHEDFYIYLKNYANHFDVTKHIKFNHMVTSVKLKDNQKDTWDVTYKDLKTDQSTTEEFDCVFVCNGHYNKAFVPEYEGKKLFRGTQIHSGRYRKPERYEGRRVLIVGSGPSGLDISIDVVKVARQVFLSHHWEHFKSPFPENYAQKPDVKELTEDSAVFEDGSCEKIDDIIYCTGYMYDCPFLDLSCGITVTRTHISPLYRHMVSVEHPSMFFVGVPQLCCAVLMMEYQAKYLMELLTGKFELPTKEKMIQHMKKDFDRKLKKDYKNELVATHTLGGYEPLYYSEMSAESGLPPFPPVYCAIRFSNVEAKSNLFTYRDYNYRVLDDEHFARTFGNETAEEVKDSGRCSLQYFLDHRREIMEEEERGLVRVVPPASVKDVKCEKGPSTE